VHLTLGSSSSATAFTLTALFTSSPARERRTYHVYIGSFGLAGAVIGAVLPLLRTVIGLYASFGFAGVIVMTAIMAAEKSGLRAHD
jgi:hypothetical protein